MSIDNALATLAATFEADAEKIRKMCREDPRLYSEFRSGYALALDKCAAELRGATERATEGKYEPEARDCKNSTAAALMSIAVSLKRIADAIVGIEINGRKQ